MRWVVFGTYDKERHPRVAVLVEGLRACGDEVVEINEPLRLDTAGRVAMLRQPWRLPILAAKLLGGWSGLLRGRRRYARRPGGDPPDAVLVGYLGHFDVRLARRLFPRTLIVLDHLVSAAGTARDRNLAESGGLKDRLMRGIDAGALRAADVVVVDTAEHRAALPAAAAPDAVVAPVGATDEWFRRGRVPGREPGPLRVIFVGVFTPLHGAPTIAEAVAELAGDEIEVTMVGTGQDHARCRQLAAGNGRVRWVDWVEGAELPALVASHHVSLGIFGTTAKARAVVPTKVYQGAAAGCAIVTSDTPPQRAALGEAAVYVPPGDAAALAAALRALAADRAEVERLGAAAHRIAVDQFTPAGVVSRLRERAAAVRGGRGAGEDVPHAA
ncbi:glycosyltransferase [Dactylosporangium sp. NPDC000244]|uniref:glycosyltransferase n=1 Tax=Dactylosporangium sp. NPDC000244 TaxID=3154365 RepID=UPI0033346E3A